MQVILVVVNLSTPVANENITGQLARYGDLASASSLALTTGTAFTISFAADTFTALGKPLYYATSADHSPLPSWINFDGSSLTFSGSTPPLLSAPQTFDFKLFVTRVSGFAEAEVEFGIAVGDHKLVFDPFEQTVDVAAGNVDFEGLRNQLLLDGRRTGEAQLVAASAQVPDWLVFDPNGFGFSGRPPAGTTSQQVIVEASDIHGDNATAVVNFQFPAEMQLLLGQIGTLNATIGQIFNYTFGITIIPNPDDVVASVDFEGMEPWIQFDAQTLRVYGDVPATATSSIVKAVLTVKSSTSSASQSQAFEILVTTSPLRKTVVQSDGTATATSVTSSNTALTSPVAEDANATTIPSGAKVGIIIGCVLLVLLLLLLGVMLWLLRRRRNAGNPGNTGTLLPWKRREKRPWISRPMLESSFRRVQRTYHGASDQTSDRMDEAEKGQSFETEAERPPRIEADLAGVGQSIRFSKCRHSGGSFLQPHDEAALNNMNRTSFGIDALGIHVPHDSMKVPAQIARDSSVYSERRRRSYRSSGLPTDRRLTGLGHGRMGQSSPTRRTGSLMRRRTLETLSWVSNSSHNMGRQIDSFLAPPRGSQLTNVSALGNAERAWIRMVTPEATPIEKVDAVDLRPFAERRRSYIKRRASSMQGNPLFAAHHAGALLSRESSQAKRAPLGKVSHNSRRLIQSAAFTRSKSSSIGIHRTSGFCRVHEKTRSSLKSGDDWESTSNYSEDNDSDYDSEIDQRFEGGGKREIKRDKGSHRLGRDGRGEVMGSIIEKDASDARKHRGRVRSRSWTRQTLSPPPLVPRQRLVSTATDVSNTVAFL